MGIKTYKTDIGHLLIPYNPNPGWRGKVTPAQIVKLESDYEKFHNEYFEAVKTGGDSRRMARRYRRFCESRK